nr:sensor domain-containing protein [Nocardia seriolae]
MLLDANLPEPPPFTFRPGLFGWLRAAFTDRTAWRALLFLVLEFRAGRGGRLLRAAHRGHHRIRGGVTDSVGGGNPTNVDDKAWRIIRSPSSTTTISTPGRGCWPSRPSV